MLKTNDCFYHAIAHYCRVVNTSDLYSEVSAFDFLYGAWLPLLILQIFFPSVYGRILSYKGRMYVKQTTIFSYHIHSTINLTIHALTHAIDK